VPWNVTSWRRTKAELGDKNVTLFTFRENWVHDSASSTIPGPNESRDSPSYADSDADLVLISSDNVSFRVHSAVMKRIS
jgi:hypothetical protein